MEPQRMSGSPQFPSFEAISGPVRDGAGKESCWSRYLLQSNCTWLTKSYLGGSGGTRRGLLVGASFGKLKKENPEFAVRPCAFFLKKRFQFQLPRQIRDRDGLKLFGKDIVNFVIIKTNWTCSGKNQRKKSELQVAKVRTLMCREA